MKLRSVQVLRGIAAVAVVLVHTTAADLKEAGTFGWGGAGVDLFFVISGFIIGTIAAGQAPGQFLAKRAWRIYPLWWVAVLPWLVVYGLRRLPVNLTLWPIWGDEFMIPSLAVGWTLCFEMLFYLGATLALATRPAVPFAVLAVLMVAAAVTDNAIADFLGNPMIFEFLLGLAITRLPRNERFAPWLILGGLLALAVSPSAYVDRLSAIDPALSWMRVLQWGLPCALIFYGGLSLESRVAGKGWNLPVLVGDASYSIYLFHMLVIWTVRLPWPLTTLAAIVAGIGAHLLIERPLLRLQPSRPRANPRFA